MAGYVIDLDPDGSELEGDDRIEYDDGTTLADWLDKRDPNKPGRPLPGRVHDDQPDPPALFGTVKMWNITLAGKYGFVTPPAPCGTGANT